MSPRPRRLPAARWVLGAAMLALAASSGSASAAGPATVAGWAHLSAGVPVEGARVEVHTLGGSLVRVAGDPTTSQNGTFGFTVERLPRRYVLVVRGGRAGGLRLEEPLETIVVGRGFRLVHVNLATTLAASYFLDRPGRDWERVVRRVERYLVLPDAVTLEASLRRSSRHFDGARFLAAAAREEGSLAAFTARLEREIERGRTRPFRGHEQRTAGRGRALAASFPITPAGLLTAAVNGVVGALAGDGVGWLLGALGFGQSDAGQPDELANVESQLQTMQTTLGAYQADLVAEQALLPPQLPDATFIDTRTGQMWALVDFTKVTNSNYQPGPVTSWAAAPGACVFPDQSPYLWDLAHPTYEQADYSQAQTQDCTAALYGGVLGLPTGGGGGYLGYRWGVPLMADVQALIAGWSGPTVAAWLTAQAGLPDLFAVASYPVPEGDPSLFPNTVVTDGFYYPNPGTALGFTDLTTCSDRLWSVGTYDTANGFPVFVQGQFCAYLRLTDGSVGSQCVAAVEFGYPCHTPVLVNPVPSYGDDGPLDFGHPGILLVWRTPASGEGWYPS